MCRQTADHGSEEQCGYPHPRAYGRAFTIALDVSIPDKEKIKELPMSRDLGEQLTLVID